MKYLSYVFFAVTGGVGICFVMAVVTAVHDYKTKKVQETAPISIPLPSS